MRHSFDPPQIGQENESTPKMQVSNPQLYYVCRDTNSKTPCVCRLSKKKTFRWVQPVGAGERIFESICFSGVLMQKGDIQELGNDMLDPSTTMGHCIEAFYKH